MTTHIVPLRWPYTIEATDKHGMVRIMSTGSWAEDPYLIAEADASTPARRATLDLMVAAPELLAALRGVMHWAECECKGLADDTPANDEPPLCDFCFAQAAITKAEGRTA